MALTFQVTLADSESDKSDAHFGLQISRDDVAQMEPVIGGTNAFFKGRGNSVWTVSFSAKKRHATISAAESYCVSHARATQGNASFSGFGLSLTNAKCRTTVRHMGVETLATYEITGTEANT